MISLALEEGTCPCDFAYCSILRRASWYVMIWFALFATKEIVIGLTGIGLVMTSVRPPLNQLVSNLY